MGGLHRREPHCTPIHLIKAKVERATDPLEVFHLSSFEEKSYSYISAYRVEENQPEKP